MTIAGSAFFSEKTSGRALLDALSQSEPLLYASGIRGSAGALAASLLFDALKRPLCIIVPTRDDALELYSELLFFRNQEDCPESDVCFFPPPDTRPYEQVLIHCDVSARRLWALYRLCASTRPLITVTCSRALQQRVVPPEILIDACCDIAVGDMLDRDALLRYTDCLRLYACQSGRGSRRYKRARRNS